MIDTLLNIVPLIATFFLISCYLPQLVHTVKTKEVESISLGFFVQLNIALFLLLLNSALLWTQNGNFGYVVMYIFNWGLAFTMLLLILKYRRRG